MICPKCSKPFNAKTNYNPTTKKNDLPYITHIHTHSLNKIMNNQGHCKHSIRTPIE